MKINRPCRTKSNAPKDEVGRAFCLPQIAPADTIGVSMDTLIDLVKRFQRSSDPDEKLALADQVVVRISPDLHLYITLRSQTQNGLLEVDDILQESLVGIAVGLEKFVATATNNSLVFATTSAGSGLWMQCAEKAGFTHTSFRAMNFGRRFSPLKAKRR